MDYQKFYNWHIKIAIKTEKLKLPLDHPAWDLVHDYKNLSQALMNENFSLEAKLLLKEGENDRVC